MLVLNAWVRLGDGNISEACFSESSILPLLASFGKKIDEADERQEV